jgi:hypothetical protein
LQIKLATTPLRDIVPSRDKELVFARSTETVASVFKKLVDNNILSMPLLEVEHNKFIAFVDMLDVLCFLVEELQLDDPANRPRVENWMTLNQFQVPCVALIARSMRNPWCVISRVRVFATYSYSMRKR